MAPRLLPPIEFLRECFSYDPNEGVVRWANRPEHHFRHPRYAAAWNRRNTGRPGVVGREGYVFFRVKYAGRPYHVSSAAVAYALTVGHTNFGEIDHINTRRDDDRVENLRPATRSQNNANRLGWAKTGLPKGVTYRNGWFVATGALNRKTRQLGVFRTPSEAHAAYCEWTKAIFGDFFNPGPSKPTVFD